MPKPNYTVLPESAIQQINSLGGPPLPTGVPTKTLKVILENRAASDAELSSYRIASNIATRRK